VPRSVRVSVNRKPFKLKGFDEDGLASVADWGDGQLAALAGDCEAGVSLRATGEKAADVAGKLPAKVQYSSDDPALRALRPTVSETDNPFPHCGGRRRGPRHNPRLHRS
jgi:hypothetical protein